MATVRLDENDTMCFVVSNDNGTCVEINVSYVNGVIAINTDQVDDTGHTKTIFSYDIERKQVENNGITMSIGDKATIIGAIPSFNEKVNDENTRTEGEIFEFTNFIDENGNHQRAAIVDFTQPNEISDDLCYCTIPISSLVPASSQETAKDSTTVTEWLTTESWNADHFSMLRNILAEFEKENEVEDEDEDEVEVSVT